MGSHALGMWVGHCSSSQPLVRGPVLRWSKTGQKAMTLWGQGGGAQPCWGSKKPFQDD